LKNISTQIEQQQLKNLHVLPMDIRIQTSDPVYIYYPGLCLSSQAAKVDQAITREPVVIIELITPTTERLILHEKSINYQRIPSVKEIIYIWPNLKIAHVDFREEESSKWTRKYYGIEDKIPLLQSNGDGELVLADIFNNMVSQM
jgi:Uma2 family endonuclease